MTHKPKVPTAIAAHAREVACSLAVVDRNRLRGSEAQYREVLEEAITNAMLTGIEIANRAGFVPEKAAGGIAA
ncbi:hypothetical protein [Pararobbsia alpina]|uniref:hypothetical protein n=1 Tax=Pararobbsia alpina TaxID=621374 RepID=UPI0039A70057